LIDLHCHILPDIDDGAQDVRTALKMAEIAAKDNIEIIVATPHILDLPLPIKKIREKTLYLNNRLSGMGLNVKILPGAEVSPFACAQIKNITDYTLNASRYLLLEFPYVNIPDYLTDILFNLTANGITPILGHPERNAYIMEKPWKIEKFLSNDVLLQLTAGSLTGLFGKDIQNCATWLLENEQVDIVASDAHSAKRRPPILSEAFDIVADTLDQETAKKLFIKYPRAIVANKKVLSST